MNKSSNPHRSDYDCAANANYHNIGAGGLSILGHAFFAPVGRSWDDKHASKRLTAIAIRNCRAVGIIEGNCSFRNVEGRL